jgi:hypothetical protein
MLQYSDVGVYLLQCTQCPQRYIGQTGRAFKTRYEDHIRDIKNIGQCSKFAQHIIEAGHEYDTIEKIMKILHTEEKSQIFNTYERFHIYEISKQNMQLNDTFTETYNPIYDMILTTLPT